MKRDIMTQIIVPYVLVGIYFFIMFYNIIPPSLPNKLNYPELFYAFTSIIWVFAFGLDVDEAITQNREAGQLLVSNT